jgi:signal transduction histidine kinase
MSEIERKSFLRIRNIVAFSIFIMLIFSFVVVDQVSKAAKAAREEALVHDKRLLSIMSQQVELAFVSVDNALRRAIENQHYNELYEGNSPEATLKSMQTLVDTMPRIAALTFVNEAGEPVYAAYKKTYKNWLNYTNYSFAGDELFQRLRKGEDNDRFIGKLPAGKNDNTGFILVGHKVQHSDGSFGGAFIAAIDPAFFTQYFSTIEQGTYSYFSLQLQTPPMMLASNVTTNPDYNNLSAILLARYTRDTTIGSYVSTYKVNDTARVYGITRTDSFPLLVITALDETDYLKAWRELRFKYFCFLTTFIMFGSLLSFLAIAMARQVIRVEKSEAAAVLASQAKSEFLANMSHELRTPLNAIIGFSEMMNSGYFGQLTPKQKERIHDINLCGSHLLNLITDILEFSKGEAGKLELVEEKVIMGEIVHETLRIMNKKIKEKQMNIIVEIDDAVPDILGDKRKIRQILLNLLSNAVKFTPETGTIKVSVRQDASKNVTMTVSDTGIGIAEKDIPVALSVFGQVHRSQSHEGTGLGLPLCKMFAELHGGRLAFGSTVGEGTTVRITFPASRNIATSAAAVA